MSTAIEHLKERTKTCMGKDGHVVGVVEYDEAIAALHIQKACLIEHFKNFILNVRLCQAIGLNKDWEQILDEQFKDL